MGKWLTLILCFCGGMSFWFSVQAIPPIMPNVRSEYALSYTQTSMLMFFVALPGVLLSIIAGKLVDKIGPKRIGSIGLLAISASNLLAALHPQFGLLQTARFFLGVGGVLVYLSMQVLIQQWFTKEQSGLAMGVFAVNMPVSTVAAFITIGGIESSFGWRASLFIPLLFSIAMLSLFHLYVAERRVSIQGFMLAGPALSNPQMWVLGSIWAFFNMTSVSYTTWGRTFFSEFKGLDPYMANILTSTMMMSAVFVGPLFGYFSDMFRNRTGFITGAPIFMTAILLSIPFLEGNTLFLASASLGVAGTIMVPSVLALPREILKERDPGVSYGILYMWLNVGVLVGPALLGFVADINHTQLAVFSTLAVYTFATFILAVILLYSIPRKVNKRAL